MAFAFAIPVSENPFLLVFSRADTLYPSGAAQLTSSEAFPDHPNKVPAISTPLTVSHSILFCFFCIYNQSLVFSYIFVVSFPPPLLPPLN